MAYVTHNGWTLHYTIGDAIAGPVLIGAVVEDFRGDSLTVLGGTSPHKVNSTGRVRVMEQGSDRADEFYPSVIGCRWVHEGGGLGGE